MKKVAYIASECVPFIKTGGLADVVGTLPRIFDKEEYDVRVIIPNYMCLPAKFKEKMRYITHFHMDHFLDLPIFLLTRTCITLTFFEFFVLFSILLLKSFLHNVI